MIEYDIEGLDAIVAGMKNYPERANPILARGINAILATLHKEATDDNLQFKLPRNRRTGMLLNSFSTGIRLASAGKLEGSIKPTVFYAEYVHEGTGRITANPFMPRIAKAGKPETQEHIQSVADQIAKAITN